ncbi:MAG: hypothetical protein ACQESN_08805 [Thermotogota bacterium]
MNLHSLEYGYNFIGSLTKQRLNIWYAIYRFSDNNQSWYGKYVNSTRNTVRLNVNWLIEKGFVVYYTDVYKHFKYLKCTELGKILIKKLIDLDDLVK